MSAKSAGSTAATDQELAAPASRGSGENAKAPHLSVRERAARGKAERTEVGRSVHGEWSAPSGRRDPVELLEEQAASRVPELVPIRYGRMLVSPFTFYRGAAYLMAADLAGSQRTGLRVQLCGDAHLSNFGGFAAPDRRLVFDINDFDETLPGPFEWDLKRLVASFAVAGRDLGFARGQRRDVNLAVTRSYREAMRALASMKTLDLWYSRVDAEALIAQFQSTASAKRRKLMEKNLAKTRAKDSLRAFSKLTTVVDGEPRIVGDPPLIVPVEDLAEGRDIEEFARDVNRGYRRTLQGDRKQSARALSLRACGAQGRGCRQRRHPRVDHADARPRQRRSAVPTAQGGTALGARAVPRQEPVPKPRPARGRGSAADAGRQRHHARLAPCDWHSITTSETSTFASCGTTRGR